MKLKKILRILSNFFAIIPRCLFTLKRGNKAGNEETRPRPSSERKSKIYHLPVSVLMRLVRSL